MCGSKILRNGDEGQAKKDLGKGFWDLEGCDPNKCGALEAFVPLGECAISKDPLEVAKIKAYESTMGREYIFHRHLARPLKASGRTDKDIEILLNKIDQGK
ncbi:hypothetical protein CPB86DRAFT_826464 [Serendipita vermifera]|nr:hypothetical protein CPB86DRAFT_826464 [Serendipita vermifera]